MTFLLSSPPYEYTSTVIGLFSLIGLLGMVLGPFYAKYIIAPITPWSAVLIGAAINMTGVVIGTYAGETTVAGPIIEAFGLDVGMQFTQIANRVAIYSVEPTGRNRVNTAFMLMSFAGQLSGTAAGNKIYEQAGWRGNGSFGVGLIGFIFVLSFMRGPWEPGWIGWSGGFSIKRRNGMGNAEDVRAAREKEEAEGAVQVSDEREEPQIVQADPEKGAIEGKSALSR
jgi:hypothetical protein